MIDDLNANFAFFSYWQNWKVQFALETRLYFWYFWQPWSHHSFLFFSYRIAPKKALYGREKWQEALGSRSVLLQVFTVGFFPSTNLHFSGVGKRSNFNLVPRTSSLFDIISRAFFSHQKAKKFWERAWSDLTQKKVWKFTFSSLLYDVMFPLSLFLDLVFQRRMLKHNVPTKYRRFI